LLRDRQGIFNASVDDLHVVLRHNSIAVDGCWLAPCRIPHPVRPPRFPSFSFSFSLMFFSGAGIDRHVPGLTNRSLYA
jgi:hypothetical protein